MDKLCGTCRFWGKGKFSKYDDDAEVDKVYQACGRILRKDDYNDGPSPEDRAYLVDGSDYFAAIRTAEDFGCTMWESNPMS